ncbi:hypothetical protein Sfulv_02080 [Streptomyces fulvorobeus]|uniref:Uncharacterized protein n=1 Tax=Streptomyces fulvorobeus TaxID=284028 RepID=A0A7J0C046_9ACTN|nr:hypothetical protein [Streptomyces fulvorobeus]GFM95397.1 hypothetical protein Sfulv_02080 [Streptomyces fulvorobeus]
MRALAVPEKCAALWWFGMRDHCVVGDGEHSPVPEAALRVPFGSLGVIRSTRCSGTTEEMLHELDP